MWQFQLTFLFFLFLILYHYLFGYKNGFPTNWPLLGMLPALLKNVHRIHEAVIDILELENLTFLFKGPWFTNMDILATANLANVHHIMSKNFANYPKGNKLKDILDVLGDGIFNTDFMVWEYHRKMAKSFLTHPNFNQFLVNKTWEKVDNGLIPLLDHASNYAKEMDLQDLFARFTFDTICTIIIDHDPMSLSSNLPRVPSSKALDDIEEVFFYRHVVPTSIWKFQRWLNIGGEKKYKKACQILDSFIYKCINIKKEQLGNENLSKQKEDDKVSIDLLTLYAQKNENYNDKFIRDTILNMFIAGRDTTSTTLSWFFYLFLKNPKIASKIKEEVDSVTLNRNNFKEVSLKLVYLHGALCETLRLYPPVVFQAKSPIKPDILPSGHHVNPNMQIIFDMYAMGRMKSIWGDDCNEFKPERWITEKGRIKHEPSYKFLAFNAGPRTCLGKDMAFTQMKIVAATIIQNYVIEAVEGHHVVPNLSIILHMKFGFKVRIYRS
ncbi:alkane hydroxylase MAH1-like [Amaranthus tricolor]|uniref:alkane hydroxylase MAH1-like n=1 Tax=Amaranthus tricolor TaxID=29722 RepID=UPI0025870FE8|nr:alkane hydroxylase MAH1-like [Amaranthus tricolor]